MKKKTSGIFVKEILNNRVKRNFSKWDFNAGIIFSIKEFYPRDFNPRDYLQRNFLPRDFHPTDFHPKGLFFIDLDFI